MIPFPKAANIFLSLLLLSSCLTGLIQFYACFMLVQGITCTEKCNSGYCERVTSDVSIVFCLFCVELPGMCLMVLRPGDITSA